MERSGKPTVVIASRGFEKDIRVTAEAFGIPGLEYVVVPFVYNNLSEREARSQTEPVADQLIGLLTSSPAVPDRSAEELAADGRARAERIIDFSAEGAESAMRRFNRVFLDRDWGDGYPLWPPTTELVEELLTGVEGGADDFVCFLPPGNGRAVVGLVAANAAMAGCKPEEMPVIMAALRAIANHDPVMRIVVTTSTSSHAPMVIVNGPMARKLGINSKQALMGPGRQNEVNIRIGRAIVLCLKNIGRWYPGVLDMDTMGTLRKHCAVIAENEEESPWEPLHVTRGFDVEDSAVTVIWTAGEWDVTMQGHLDAQQLADALGTFHGGNYHGYFSAMQLLQEGEPYPLGRVLLLAPPHARPLSEGGFTKAALERRLFDLSHESIYRLREPARKLYADGKIQAKYRWLFELSEEEARQRTLPIIEVPELYAVVVAGSVRAKDMLLPFRGFPVTERITRTPDGKA